MLCCYRCVTHQHLTTCAVLLQMCVTHQHLTTCAVLLQMWALSPSIFDLLTKRLEPTNLWMTERHPCVQYAILHTLYGHCCRHGNFVSSSSLLSTDTVPMAAMSQETSEHLSRILRLLVEVLEEGRTSFDVRCLALKWVQDIVQGLQSSAHVFVVQPCLAVVRAVIAQGGCVLSSYLSSLAFFL